MKKTTLFCMKKILNIRKILLLIMFFVTEFVIAIASQEFKKKLLNFHDDFLHISKIENS